MTLLVRLSKPATRAGRVESFLHTLLSCWSGCKGSAHRYFHLSPDAILPDAAEVVGLDRVVTDKTIQLTSHSSGYLISWTAAAGYRQIAG